MASQDSKINSTNVGLYDYFGSSVRLCGKGNGSYNSSVVDYRAIVSAPNNEYIGNVYIFRNTTEVGGSWSQIGHVLSSNVSIGDQYGYAVDIAGGYFPHIYGVSAPSKADGRGAVYIFNSSYNQTHEVLGPSEYAYFGDSVKFNYQASKLIVGATGIGSAYVLDSGNGYQLGTALQQGDLSDYFGFSVSIAGNNASSNWTIIGAPGTNNGTGAAYIYNGTNLHATLPLNVSGALYPSELVEGDYFGNSVALDASGDTAVVCAFLQNSQGAAHVFVRNTSTNVWSYQSKIVPNDIQVGDSFGDSVSIDSSGDSIVIGASSKLSGGAMYTFIRSGTTWTQREKIVSSNLSTGDKFGYSVGIAVNARKAIAGAYSATSSSNIFSGGSAYAYSIPDNYYSGTNRIIHETVPEAEPVSTFEKFNIYVNGQPVENTPTTWAQSRTMTAPSTSNIFFGNVEYTSGLSTLEPGSKLHVGNFTVLTRNAYDTWDNTALDFYNEGPPSQMLSVGGEAIIEHKLGIGIQTPDKPLHVLGDVRVSDPFPTGTVIDISSKSSILREVSKIKPVSQLPYEVVGTSVSITKNGKTAVIGAVRNPPGNETYGHVYIFDWKGDSWEQNAILRPNNVKSNDNFGTSSAISNDGKTVAIGAWRDNTVYIFTRTGDTWSQDSKLTTTSSPGDRFGYVVDISEDGSTVVVGAPDKKNNNLAKSGSAYVYMRVGAINSWVEAHIVPTFTSSFWPSAYNAGDEFGTSVSMSADGNTIVVGAPKAKIYSYYGGGTPGSNFNNAGAAYVFKRSGGTNWAQQTWLPDIWGIKESVSGWTSEFPWTNASQHTTNTGVLFSYGHAANGYGMASTQIPATGTYMGDRFGNSVNISDDGNTIIVGAPGRSRTYVKTKEENEIENKWGIGTAYIFQFADGSWVEQAHLQASDYEIFDYFGFSTSISSDGNTVMIGAFNDDPTYVDSHGNKSIIQNGGSVYIYTRTVDGVWSEKNKITPDVPVTDGAYGASLCLSSDGNTALITGASSGSGAKPAPAIPWVGNTTYRTYNLDGTVNSNGIFITWNGTTADGIYIYDTYDINAQNTDADIVRYNPNTKTWLLGQNANNSLSNNNSSSNTANLPDCSIYDPEYVYIWLSNGILWGWWKNPYRFTTEGTVYSYNLPDDFSNPYYNTLNVPSNLYVRDTIYTTENIGIKTSDPKRPLHVDGDVRITDNTENVDFSVDKGSIYEESIITLPRTGDGDIVTEYDHVGENVRISGDGYTAFVSSHTHGGGWNGPTNTGFQHPKGGKIQVYVRSGHKWTLQATLQPDGIDQGDDFGISIGTTPDGNKIAVGATWYSPTVSGTTYNGAGSLWVYKREGTTWSIESFLVPEDVYNGTAVTWVGYTIGISDDGTRIVASSLTANSSRGRLYVFELANDGTWYQQATLTASDGQTGDRLGIEVSISGDGNTIAAGAWGADTGPSGTNANGGAVYIYARGVDVWSNNAWQATWNQQTKIVPSDIEDNMFFGGSCKLSSDGNTLAIGARDANYPGTSNNIGAAYVFVRSGTTWSQQTKIFPFDPYTSGQSNFGPTSGISISSDGNRIAVGRTQPSFTQYPGVYIYDREGTTWTQFTKLTPSDANPGEYGYSIALSSIGDRVIVGDIIKIVNGKSRAGAAYIYSLPVVDATTLNVSSSIRSRGGLLVNDNTGIGTLEPEKKLHVEGDIRISNKDNAVDLSVINTQYEEEFTSTIALNAATSTSGPTRAALGVSCALSYDGDVAVTGGYSGEIYIYEKKGAEWKLTQTVKTSRTYADTWGNQVNISGDGKTIAAAYIDDATTSYVSIVVRIKGIWMENVIFDNPGLVQNNWFGQSVALNEKGDCLVVGAYNDKRTSGGSNTGVVYVYHKIEGCSWHTTPTAINAYMNSNENDANYQFGYSVDISGDGDKILVGATKAKPSAGGASNKTCGCLYGFDRNTSTNAITFYRKWFNREPSGDDGDWYLSNDDEWGRIVRISGDGSSIMGGDKWNYYDPSWGTRTDCGKVQKGPWTASGDNGLNGIGSSTWFIGRTNNIKMGSEMLFMNYNGRIWGCSALPEDPSSSDGVTGGSHPNCGLVYVFEDTNWHTSIPSHPQTTQRAIAPTTYQSNIYFGTCVDINKDGTKLIIGSPYENSSDTIHIYTLPLASSTTIPSLSLSGILNVPHGIGYDRQNPTGLAPLTVNARGGDYNSTTNGVNVVGGTDIVNGSYGPAILAAESPVGDAYVSLKKTGGSGSQNYHFGFMSGGALSGGDPGSTQSSDSYNALYIKNNGNLGVFWNPDLDMYVIARRKIQFGQSLSYDTGDYRTESNSGTIGYGVFSNNTSGEAAALDIVGAGCEQSFSYWARPDPTRRIVRIWDRLYIGNGTLCSSQHGNRGIIEVTQSAGSQSVTYRYLANQTDSHGPYTGSASYSIWADGRIRSNEFNAVSDERIKKDIVDVVDASALEKLRLLKPKTYKYKDTLARTNQTVYGFIAQEVANVIPYAVSTATDSIPNILTTSSVTRNDTFFPPDSNVYYMPSNVHVSESSNIFDIHLDTSIPGLSLSNTSTISITTDKDVNDTFSVVKHEGDVITITSGKEIETTNVFSNVSNAYIYGEVVSDFNNLNKDSIWTISCAALQEVDRQLQAEKTKVATLETQVADLLARVTALENN